MNTPRDYAELKLIVDQQLEESTMLEFKQMLPVAGKNDDMSRDLAAMANTDGGLLIYGIAEDGNGRASQLMPFEIKDSSDRLNLIADSLDEAVSLIEILTITDPANSSLGFLVVSIASDDRKPHLFHGEGWGRSPRGNFRLTRRQLGELFARSKGFAQEFSISAGKPGRLRVVVKKSSRAGTSNRDFHLVFSNDGEADIYDVEWHWTDESKGVQVMGNKFPMKVAPAGLELPILALLTMGSSQEGDIEASWTDAAGQRFSAVWPISWM